jgi:prephenate dehydrogenase
MVVLALPVGAIVDSFKKISPFLKKGAIVFDLGSSKVAIEKAARKYLPKNISFVGCHPLCGGEKAGAEFSNHNLYNSSLCLIVASKNKAAKTVENLWNSLGSKVMFMSPQRHDKILSSVSHLPHLISFSFADSIPKGHERFGSTSFKDLTRISASSAFIWADIFLSNKKNILSDLNRFTKALKKFEGLLKKQDKKSIVNLVTKINSKQERIS